MPGRRAPLLAPDVLRWLILTQRHEPAVPEMVVRRPLDEFKLTDEDRLQPPALCHLCFRQSLSPSATPGFGKVREGAVANLECRKLLEQLIARRRRKAIPGTRCVDEAITVVIANHHGVERFGAERVSSDDEFLASVDTHLHPRARAYAWL